MHMQGVTTCLVLHRIFHPSDFSPASEVAFAHALKLALSARAALRLMHVAADAEDRHWSDFPGVRATLVRWGLLPTGSPREAVGQLGLDIGTILWPRADPVGVLLHYLDAHPADLVVLATHQRAGMARWLHRAVAEPVARYAGAMTLFLPQGAAGFIALDNGTVAVLDMISFTYMRSEADLTPFGPLKQSIAAGQGAVPRPAIDDQCLLGVEWIRCCGDKRVERRRREYL